MKNCREKRKERREKREERGEKREERRERREERGEERRGEEREERTERTIEVSGLNSGLNSVASTRPHVLPLTLFQQCLLRRFRPGHGHVVVVLRLGDGVHGTSDFQQVFLFLSRWCLAGGGGRWREVEGEEQG